MGERMHLPALVHLLIAGISEDIPKARSEELQAELTERQIVEAQMAADGWAAQCAPHLPAASRKTQAPAPAEDSEDCMTIVEYMTPQAAQQRLPKGARINTSACIWCETKFAARKSGGSAQRFCSSDCRQDFHIAWPSLTSGFDPKQTRGR